MLAGRPHVAHAVSSTTDRIIAALDVTPRAIAGVIVAHLRMHPASHEDTERLRGVPGSGAENVAYILALVHRWMTLTDGRGTEKGLAAYIGRDPPTYESGTSVHRRAALSRMGDQAARRRLSMGIRGGVRGDHPLRAYYQRLVGRGKPRIVALVATARKLLTGAGSVFRRQALFDAARIASAPSTATEPDARAYAGAPAA